MQDGPADARGLVGLGLTSWVTNWLNPDEGAGTIAAVRVDAGRARAAASIPMAFDDRGLCVRARLCGYAGRALHVHLSASAAAPPPAAQLPSVSRSGSASAAFWIAGGLAQSAGARLLLWAVALGIEYVSPAVRFWIPKYGASSVMDWYVEGGPSGRTLLPASSYVSRGIHRRDRRDLCRSEMDLRGCFAAFLSAFYGRAGDVVALFPQGCGGGASELLFGVQASRGGWRGLAYTYLHLPIVAGIILSAVADDVVLQHPAGHSDVKVVVSAVGGPMLFLIGTILFKHAIRGWYQLSHIVGIVALGVLGWFGAGMSPLMLSIATTLLMVIVAVWKSLSLRSGAAGSNAQSDATSA